MIRGKTQKSRLF